MYHWQQILTHCFEKDYFNLYDISKITITCKTFRDVVKDSIWHEKNMIHYKVENELKEFIEKPINMTMNFYPPVTFQCMNNILRRPNVTEDDITCMFWWIYHNFRKLVYNRSKGGDYKTKLYNLYWCKSIISRLLIHSFRAKTNLNTRVIKFLFTSSNSFVIGTTAYPFNFADLLTTMFHFSDYFHKNNKEGLLWKYNMIVFLAENHVLNDVIKIRDTILHRNILDIFCNNVKYQHIDSFYTLCKEINELGQNKLIVKSLDATIYGKRNHNQFSIDHYQKTILEFTKREDNYIFWNHLCRGNLSYNIVCVFLERVDLNYIQWKGMINTFIKIYKNRGNEGIKVVKKVMFNVIDNLDVQNLKHLFRSNIMTDILSMGSEIKDLVEHILKNYSHCLDLEYLLERQQQHHSNSYIPHVEIDAFIMAYYLDNSMSVLNDLLSLYNLKSIQCILNRPYKLKETNKTTKLFDYIMQ